MTIYIILAAILALFIFGYINNQKQKKLERERRLKAEQEEIARQKRIEEETEAFEEKIIEAKGTAKTAKPKVSKKEKERFRELVASAETAFEEKRYQDAYNLYEDAILVNPFDETVSEKMESLKPFI